jgi:hypothetical protein
MKITLIITSNCIHEWQSLSFTEQSPVRSWQIEMCLQFHAQRQQQACIISVSVVSLPYSKLRPKIYESLNTAPYHLLGLVQLKLKRWRFVSFQFLKCNFILTGDWIWDLQFWGTLWIHQLQEYLNTLLTSLFYYYCYYYHYYYYYYYYLFFISPTIFSGVLLTLRKS